jgi:SAM-dependent methyltransferase
MLEHARDLAERLIAERHLGPESLVVEVASNDGYLLKNYRERGIPVLGIEPAENVAAVARERSGIPTLCEFFGRELAERLVQEGRRADVLHANNVLAHVPDLEGVVSGMTALLGDRGVAVIEVPYVRDLIERLEFDTIYHEHLCYFSLGALDRLFRRNGAVVVDVERIPIHGGSLRIWGQRKGPAGAVPSAAVQSLLREEVALGLHRVGYYATFAERVEHRARELRALLRRLRAEGRRIAAYGASAKGSTLLNYVGIGRDVLDFVADRSPVKQGRFLPGVHVPIVSPERLLERMPDYVLLLAWNLRDEILAQQAEYRRRGGRFIVPVPELEIV